MYSTRIMQSGTEQNGEECKENEDEEDKGKTEENLNEHVMHNKSGHINRA